MAKITGKLKTLILADHLTGKFSQRELAKKHGISIGAINNLTKGIDKKNEPLVNAQIAILTAQAILPNEQITAIMNTAKDEMYNKGLVINASQLNLARITEHLSKNTKIEKVSAGDGVQSLESVELNANDYKAAQDAIDKASITLGVNSRNTSSVTVQNTNAQITQIKRIIVDPKDG